MFSSRRLSARSIQGLRAFFISLVLTLGIAGTQVYQLAELRAYDARFRFYEVTLADRDGEVAPVSVLGYQDVDRNAGFEAPEFLELLEMIGRARPAAIYIADDSILDTLKISKSDLPPEVRVWDLDEAAADSVARARMFLGQGEAGLASCYDRDGNLRGVPWDHPVAQFAVEMYEEATGRKVERRGPRLMMSTFGFGGDQISASLSEADASGTLSLSYLRDRLLEDHRANRSHVAKVLQNNVVFIERQTTEAHEVPEISTPKRFFTVGLIYLGLNQTLMQQFTVTELPGPLIWFGAGAMVLGFCLALSGRKPSEVVRGALLPVGLLLLLGASTLLLGFDLPVVLLLVWVLSAVSVLVLLELRRGRKVLASFGGKEDAQFEGEESEATMVFTNLPPALLEMERNNSKDLLKHRREYNTVLAHIAKKYHGMVLDYQGDAQMLGFGLRYDDDPEHAAEAVSAALEIVRDVSQLCERWSVPVEKTTVHAGVCTGMIALGHLGAEQKQDIAAIGDTTNTAARLMGAAMKAKVAVLAAKSTWVRAEGTLQGESRPPVALKGKSAPVEVYEVSSVDEEWQKVNRAKQKSQYQKGGTIEYRAERVSDLLPSLALAGLGIVCGLLLLSDRVLNDADAAVADRLHEIFAFAEADQRIVLFGIDEASISDPRLGRFPWSRGVYAEILNNLAKSGYEGVFFDVFFKAARADDPEGDEALAAALAAEPRAVLGGVLVKNARGRLEKPHLFPAVDYDLLKRRHQIGLAHSSKDRDGRLRSAYLAHWETESHDSDEARKRWMIPSGGTALLLKPEERLAIEGQGIWIGDHWYGASVSRLESASIQLRFGPAATPDGAPPEKGSYRLYSVNRLLDPSDPIFQELKGKYLLIGQTMTVGENNEVDRVETVGGRIKGVEVHARVLDNLLNRNYLSSLEEWQRILCVILVGAVTAYILVKYRESSTFLLKMGEFIVGLWILDVLMLYFFDLHGEIVLWTATVGLVAALVVLGRYFLTFKALSRVIPEEVAAELLFHHALRDRRQVATILLTDIRGYTTLSEGRTAVAMLDVLNEYHKRTVACYEKFGGQALTYQGDAQIVVFGVFGNRKNPAADAVEAALGLQKICDELREEWGIENRDDFDVGAGLCTGEVEVGLLGGSSNLQYSVVGETVRKAHKVQSLSTELEAPVIIDEETFLAAAGEVTAEDLGLVRPQGLDHDIRLYRAKKAKDSSMV